MNTNFGGIICSGNKNVFHALKHELKKELVSVGCPAQLLHNYTQHDQIHSLWAQAQKISRVTMNLLIQITDNCHTAEQDRCHSS
jgi:hypothetical protein